MKKLLLLVGLLIALVAFVSGDSDKEDEASFQEKELDLLDRKLRNADPKRKEQSGKIKSQGGENSNDSWDLNVVPVENPKMALLLQEHKASAGTAVCSYFRSLALSCDDFSYIVPII